ncbi:MAG: hypothetical protein V4510_12630 [bacterium]
MRLLLVAAVLLLAGCSSSQPTVAPTTASSATLIPFTVSNTADVAVPVGLLIQQGEVAVYEHNATIAGNQKVSFPPLQQATPTGLLIHLDAVNQSTWDCPAQPMPGSAVEVVVGRLITVNWFPGPGGPGTRVPCRALQ